jgi:hypothetical protein
MMMCVLVVRVIGNRRSWWSFVAACRQQERSAENQSK